MLKFLTLLLVVLVGVHCCDGVVHRISAQQHHLPLPKDTDRNPRFNYELAQFHHDLELAKQGNVGVLNLNRTSWLTDITIGTPPQTFVAFIDIIEEPQSSVIGPEFNLTNVNSKLPKKHVFDASLSSTFVNQTKKFRSSTGWGDYGQDVLQVGGATASNISFGVLDYGWELENYPIDAVLGLAPTQPDSDELNGTVWQMASQWDAPLMSLWHNLSYTRKSKMQVTLGALDKDNCQQNWLWTPLVSEKKHYGVHINSISGTANGTIGQVALNNTLVIAQYNLIYAPMDVLYVIGNATNAVYNSTHGFYTVECDSVSSLPDIVFNIGGGSENTTTKAISIPVSKLVTCWKSRKLCYLSVIGYSSSSENRVFIGAPLLNTYCMAFNLQDKLLGLANSKSA